MRNKKIKIIFMSLLIIIGIILITLGFNQIESIKISGIMFGLGAGLIGAAISQLATIRIYSKNPKLLQKKIIDVKDERNTTIRNNAKSKVYDIFNILFPIMTLVLVLLNTNYFLIIILLGVYGLRIALLFIFINKYNNEI